jgi:hypothetical protein
MNREPKLPPDVEKQEDKTVDHWKIDRHVPLALLGGIALQTGIAIWWAASFSAAITGRVDVLEKQMAGTVAVSAPVSERLVRVEVQLGAVKETVDKIEALIRQPVPRP